MDVWSGFDRKNIFFSDRFSNKIHFPPGHEVSWWTFLALSHRSKLFSPKPRDQLHCNVNFWGPFNGNVNVLLIIWIKSKHNSTALCSGLTRDDSSGVRRRSPESLGPSPSQIMGESIEILI